ncbi:hypothetical protein [Magnetovibrio blakemorei]|uniref:Uncharacterized protein n=1 Tax=Magnetovibrio blakemorei TaxID=28181 RepID=A0A1E5Q7S5_9PROT|nr:hypothetical protein [Magnetovibrio blakemorei]OEJ67245.1 hypothetical protein BEN30_09690 [Magnetovibrio blakemorei]
MMDLTFGKVFKSRSEAETEILIGDLFVGPGKKRGIWTVRAVYRRMGLPTHVRLDGGCADREMTIAASVVLDRRLFRRA